MNYILYFENDARANTKEQIVFMDKLKHIGFQRVECLCVSLKLLILSLKKKYPAIVMYCMFLFNDPLKYVGKSTNTLRKMYNTLEGKNEL
jgi:hypothetical protein